MPDHEPAAAAQQISEVFRGSAGAAPALKPAGTVRGIQPAAIPAFVAGQELADLADTDQRIVVLTADLAGAGRTSDFAARHPDRFFNMGPAEQNMTTVAAGMASAGLRPYVSTFAAYAALLCCEQIRTDLAYPGMPVRILAHHSGMSLGYYGTSHHSLEDLSAMRGIAGLTVVCAADANQLRAILRASVDLDGPLYIRMGRGRDPEVYPEVPAGFRFGRASRLTEGSDLTLITTGSQVRPCLDAAGLLRADGISVRVVDMHTISPIDTGEAIAAAAETAAVMTVEEHNITGGLGSAVAETLLEAGATVRFRRAGVPDEHVILGPPAALYAHYELDAAGIAVRARRFLAP
ncbi:MAG: transketolase C-terminal domain-containing protein [Actinomycetota bacterium]